MMRNEFRKVVIGEICYLYPWPVIKGKKYIIEVDIDQADLLIESIFTGALTSPDESPSYLTRKGLHQDGFTTVFYIDIKEI